jgi:hypothetical protein
MSIQPPRSNWKCAACGIENGFGNAVCAVCGGPRPADAGPLDAPDEHGAWPQTSDESQGKLKKMGVPAGIIVLIAYEALMILYSLYYSLVITPALYHQVERFGSQFPTHGGPNPFPGMLSMNVAIGVAMAVFWGIVRAFLIMGFLMRWSFVRILGIVRYGLIIAGGVFGILGMVVGMIAMTAMKSTIGAAKPPMPFPSPGGFGALGPSMATAMGLGLMVSFVGLCVGVFAVFYLTTKTAKEYFSV